jgi:hypothetical protein
MLQSESQGIGISSFQAMVASNLEAVMAKQNRSVRGLSRCWRVMPLSGADVAGYDIPFAFCNLLLLFFSFARGRTSEQFSFRWGRRRWTGIGIRLDTPAFESESQAGCRRKV